MMRPFRFLFPVALLLLGAALVGASVQTEIVDPFVEVRTADGLGSGTIVLVDEEVLVLTAGHVVEGAKKNGMPVRLFRQTGRRRVEIEAEIVAYSPPEEEGGDDLALLKPGYTTGLVPASLGLDTVLEAGQDAWYIGSPAGLHASLERTIINKPEHYLQIGKKTQKMFLVNGHAWFGSSGGGVFTRSEGKFHLVGIITRVASDSPKTPAGCEHPETIRKFLDAYLEGTYDK